MLVVALRQRPNWTKTVGRMPKLSLFLLCVLGFLLSPQAVLAQGKLRVPLCDGFDFPVGKPDADGYYTSRGVRLREPVHFGEDWNGKGGGDTDLGDPVYACADGVVTWAYNVHAGWGNVVMIRHAYRDPASSQVRFCDSLYGHLTQFYVKVGQSVKRGDKIGTIGTNFGMYPAHLHFELRNNIFIGMQRESVNRDWSNWFIPSDFIRKYRRLNREWGKVDMPIGTYTDYNGFKGL
jgi:murein DD-endopeptidase MepM/ murein hydrolase activator NlpD